MKHVAKYDEALSGVCVWFAASKVKAAWHYKCKPEKKSG